MPIVYDSCWWPAASGTIGATVDLNGYNVARLIYSASGTNGTAAPTATWVAGSDAPIPGQFQNYNYVAGVPGAPAAPPAFAGNPKVTGAIAGVAAPGANATNSYVLSAQASGGLIAYVPQRLQVGLTPGASSFARIIVEAY
jgi:hypothetical protein